MLTLTCCQDHILRENIWFVCSETSYSGDERRCHRCGTNERTITEDRATQPMEAGGWVSQKLMNLVFIKWGKTSKKFEKLKHFLVLIRTCIQGSLCSELSIPAPSPLLGQQARLHSNKIKCKKFQK